MPAVPELLVGPILRHIGENDATVFVETDEPCEVAVLGHTGETFTVEDHHYALVVIDGLGAGDTHPYEVHLDGSRAWPPPDYELPQPRIRTLRDDGTLTMIFGSCRASAPHHPPHTFAQWLHPKGKGIDVLRTYAMRMLRQPSALWPDALVMLGDQLYADQPPPNVQETVAPRQVHRNGPVEVLEDFEEYTVGYCDAWTHPYVRWMLSTVPSAMIFDDHEINDKWKTSQAWLDEKRQTDWYEGRVIGGLMSYWIYQHLGNLSPRELAEDEVYQRVLASRDDASEIVREHAERAEDQPSHSQFSFCRDLGPARLLMLDSRAGRYLEPTDRRIMSDDEWEWVESKVDGTHDHLMLGSSLPVLLPYGMHHIEAWSEAVSAGAWGKRLSPLGEKVRIGANLDHWACFGHSFRKLEQLIIDVATGRCGEAPDSILMFGGDVHHCWVSEVSLPDEEPASRTKVWQTVCSGMRKDLDASQRVVLHGGHTRAAAAIGALLARSARVPQPRLRWRHVTRPHFRNQIGTLMIAGGEIGVRIERVSGGWRKPRLTTVIEHKLL